MSDVIAIVLAAFPIVAFVALIVETLRTGTGATGEYPPVGLLYRAYGA